MSIGSNSSQYISELIKTGSDAMKNLYYLDFSGKHINNYSQSLKVRVSNFTPPVPTQGKHTFNYISTSVDMPTPSFTMDKTLKFTFRLDEGYELYKCLLNQQSTTMNAGTGWATNQVPSESSGGITVKAYVFDRFLGNDPDNEDNYRPMYIYRYCYITDITGLNYSYDNANPMTISATMKFLDFDDATDTLLE